jgi:hypothetical protein
MEDEFDRSRAEKHFLPRTGQLSASQNPSKNHKIDGYGTNVALHGLTGLCCSHGAALT